jgi:hypothetical protein
LLFHVESEGGEGKEAKDVKQTSSVAVGKSSFEHIEDYLGLFLCCPVFLISIVRVSFGLGIPNKNA